MTVPRAAPPGAPLPRAPRGGGGVVDWSALPADLLGEVVRAAPTRDLLHTLPGVCAAWRAQSRAEALGRLPAGLLIAGGEEGAPLASLWRSARRRVSDGEDEWEEDDALLRSIPPSFCHWLLHGSNLLSTGQFEHEFWKVARGRLSSGRSPCTHQLWICTLGSISFSWDDDDALEASPESVVVGGAESGGAGRAIPAGDACPFGEAGSLAATPDGEAARAGEEGGRGSGGSRSRARLADCQSDDERSDGDGDDEDEGEGDRGAEEEEEGEASEGERHGAGAGAGAGGSEGGETGEGVGFPAPPPASHRSGSLLPLSAVLAPAPGCPARPGSPPLLSLPLSRAYASLLTRSLFPPTVRRHPLPPPCGFPRVARGVLTACPHAGSLGGGGVAEALQPVDLAEALRERGAADPEKVLEGLRPIVLEVAVLCRASERVCGRALRDIQEGHGHRGEGVREGHAHAHAHAHVSSSRSAPMPVARPTLVLALDSPSASRHVPVVGSLAAAARWLGGADAFGVARLGAQPTLWESGEAEQGTRSAGEQLGIGANATASAAGQQGAPAPAAGQQGAPAPAAGQRAAPAPATLLAASLTPSLAPSLSSSGLVSTEWTPLTLRVRVPAKSRRATVILRAEFVPGVPADCEFRAPVLRILPGDDER